MHNHTARIDDEAMATDFAPGMRTYAYLAMKYGLTLAAVARIVSQWRPPGLPWTLEEVRQTTVGRAQVRLTELVETAVEVLAAGVGGGATPLSMAAAKQILDRVLGPPPRGGGCGSARMAPPDPAEPASATARAYVRLDELAPDTLQLVARDMLACEKARPALAEGPEGDHSKRFGRPRAVRQVCRGLPAPTAAGPLILVHQCLPAASAADRPPTAGGGRARRQ